MAREKVPVVLQSQASECGLACLAMLVAHHGNPIHLSALRRRYGASSRGMGLDRLIEIANHMGLEARPLRGNIAYLKRLDSPCVLHWGMNHYVVFSKSTRSGIYINDPAVGQRHASWEEVDQHFTGVLLELYPGASFCPEPQASRISIKALTGRISGLKRTVAKVLGIATAIELMALILPFQSQWIIDQAISSGDRSLVLTITAGFLLLACAHYLLNLARSWVMSWIGATLSAQWINNLAAHLLKLPMAFFESRHLGDVVSRFGSVRSVQATLTGRFIDGMLSGLTGFLSLIILICYSAKFSTVVVAFAALYAAFRWSSWRLIYRANSEQLIFSARQQTELMESIRGAQTIKLANQVPARHAKLSNATWEMASRDMRSQRVSLAFSATTQFMLTAQRVILVGAGAYATISNQFTIGMLAAFLLYADQFASRFSGFVDNLIDLKALSLHAERIADIALEEPEMDGEGSYSGPLPPPSIQVRNLWFRYSESEPWIFSGLDLDIEAGESVAIVGPSGCGKSTLTKLLLGLLTPQQGSVCVGHIDIRKLGLRSFRDMTGSVMQEDQLFAGSIAENISFSCDIDEEAMQNVISAAKAAAVHEDISEMPMAYETMIGDMGSSLSGGQKQRIILARALYRKPRILVLDEATSHLDEAREKQVNAAVKGYQATRITIAHRSATIAMADRVIELEVYQQQGEGSPRIEAFAL